MREERRLKLRGKKRGHKELKRMKKRGTVNR